VQCCGGAVFPPASRVFFIYTKKGSLWQWDILKLLDSFKGMATVIVQDGKTCFLRDDLWEG